MRWRTGFLAKSVCGHAGGNMTCLGRRFSVIQTPLDQKVRGLLSTNPGYLSSLIRENSACRLYQLQAKPCKNGSRCAESSALRDRACEWWMARRIFEGLVLRGCHHWQLFLNSLTLTQLLKHEDMSDAQRTFEPLGRQGVVIHVVIGKFWSLTYMSGHNKRMCWVRFDCTKSDHTREQWMEALRRAQWDHIF